MASLGQVGLRNGHNPVTHFLVKQPYVTVFLRDTEDTESGEGGVDVGAGGELGWVSAVRTERPVSES